MRSAMRGILSVLTLLALVSATAHAQWVGPVNPNYPPPPAPPSYQPYYPTAPGGFYTGNPSYPGYWNPNAVVGGTGSATSYWDPYRGWVTNSQSTSVLSSATSPGRAPMPGASIQYYNYWNGYQWVRGSRWLGMDGLWHGDNQNTTVGPGGTSTDRTVYSVRPGTTAPRSTTTGPTSTTVARPTYPAPTARPVYTQPRTTVPYVAPRPR